MLELLSPAGNAEKLKTAVYFGADAVYFAGKKYGLRASCDNFEADEIEEYIKYCHRHGVKAYITINIIAHNDDLNGLDEYIKYLEKIGADAVIAADIGVICRIREAAPGLAIHVSTQANITNKYAAKFFADLGVKRLILARELSITEIKEIREYIPNEVELEAFVHGAMCISYSGRCLLSNYLSGRDSNRGQCVQACRWEYSISEKSRRGSFYDVIEDERGTYILNSKDLNMLEHLRALIDVGVTSFKIEGRMKSPYYVATVTNAYRRVLDKMKEDINYKPIKTLKDELYKASHRQYTTGFNFKDRFKEERECLESSMPVQTHEFMALVLEDRKDGFVLVQQRNRFEVGEELEILSPNDTFNKKFKVTKIKNLNGKEVEMAKLVQEKLMLKTKLSLKAGDILRKRVAGGG
ncbi:MAG: U32 family peptidase [Christensenellaceae bacterium]|jgi:putative protease|nr:U32 family peptidase [Christensenellaceae bacterium]